MPLLEGKAFPQFSEYWWWIVCLQNIPLAFSINNFGPDHYWSLAVEEHFYLLWPLLVLLFNRRQLVPISIAIVLLSIALRPIFLAHDVSIYHLTVTRLDALALGCLIAIFEPEILKLPEKYAKIFFTSLLLAGVAIMAIFTIYSGSSALWLQTVKQTIIGLFYFFFLGFVIATNKSSFVGRLLNNWMMRYIGKISFGLYVYHLFCFYLADKVIGNVNPLFELPMVFLFTGLVSHLSFTCIESPFLRLKDKIGS